MDANETGNRHIILPGLTIIHGDQVCFTGLQIYGNNSLNFTYIGTTITLLYRGDMWFHHIYT